MFIIYLIHRKNWNYNLEERCYNLSISNEEKIALIVEIDILKYFLRKIS
jgi:hypothetical protein